MRFAFFLAFRYLRTPRRHRLAQFTALAAIIGIAFGVAAMIVSQALANGFRQAMQDKILENTAHITILRADDADIFDWQELSEKIKTVQGVKSVSATSFGNALVIGKTNSSFATLRGVQSQSGIEQSQISNLKSKIAIGKILAEKTGLSVGDSAQIISGSRQIGESFSPTSTAVEVGEIFSTGLYEYDSTWIKLSLEDTARISGKSFVAATALEIKTADIYNSDKTAKLIQEKLGANFKVFDWQEANRPLFAALALERRVAVLIISLIVFVAVLNITTSLALVVNERRLDIAVLKTCGATPKSIVFIFLLEGALLGTIGTILGILLGLIFCFLGNYFNLVNLPPDVYSISEIRLQNNFGEIFMIAAGAFLLSLMASAFPAWTAARVRPMENLRN